MANSNISGQEWIWSKVIPEFPGYYFSNFDVKPSGEFYFFYRSTYNNPKSTLIMQMDSSGNTLYSFIFQFEIWALTIDAAGNFLVIGEFVDSFTYQGTTVYSVGQKDNFLLETTMQGNLIFLKSFGTEVYEGYIGGISVDSTGNIYFSKNVNNTIFIENDSIPYNDRKLF